MPCAQHTHTHTYRLCFALALYADQFLPSAFGRCRFPPCRAWCCRDFIYSFVCILLFCYLNCCHRYDFLAPARMKNFIFYYVFAVVFLVLALLLLPVFCFFFLSFCHCSCIMNAPSLNNFACQFKGYPIIEHCRRGTLHAILRGTHAKMAKNNCCVYARVCVIVVRSQNMQRIVWCVCVCVWGKRSEKAIPKYYLYLNLSPLIFADAAACQQHWSNKISGGLLRLRLNCA